MAEPGTTPIDPDDAPGDIVAGADSDVLVESPVASPSPRITQRGLTVAVSALLLIVLAAVATYLPVPYVSLSPGPLFNTIGTYNGKKIVEVPGNATYPAYPVSGNLDMTTVSERGGPFGGMTILSAIRGWLDPDIAVVPREVIYPDAVDPEEVRIQNAEEFATSQSYAVAAGLHEAGVPVTEDVTVTAVREGSPAQGKLKASDHVVAIDGVAVTAIDQVGKAVQAKPVGSTIRFAVKRSGSTATQDVDVVSAAGDDGKPYVGISLGILYEGPFPITVNLQDVGGPSAGMMFSLSIVDQLTKDGINGGRYVAGTGTIDPDGTVGAIGGIQQKIAAARNAGAELFIAPAGNCNDVLKANPGSMPIVKVSTLHDAVVALKTWRTSGATGLPACTPS